MPFCVTPPFSDSSVDWRTTSPQLHAKFSKAVSAITPLKPVKMVEHETMDDSHADTSNADAHPAPGVSFVKSRGRNLDVDAWIESVKSCRYLPEEDMMSLCDSLIERLVHVPNIVQVDLPATICGDIHGQFYDLLELFRVGGQVPDTKYVFMVNEGFRYMFNEMLCNVWSAPNYCYRCGNTASVLAIAADQRREIKYFEAVAEEDRVRPDRIVSPYFL
ncbi:unnamed protein product, partial [Mesorhabditis spiculigera]